MHLIYYYSSINNESLRAHVIGLLRHCARVSLRLLFMQTFPFNEMFDECNMLGLDVCVFLGKALYHLHMHTHTHTHTQCYTVYGSIRIYWIRTCYTH